MSELSSRTSSAFTTSSSDAGSKWLGRSTSSFSRPTSVNTREQGMTIKHGLLSDYHFRVGGHIKSVIFTPQSQSTVVHHSKGFVTYQRRSVENKFEQVELAKRIDKLLYDVSHDVYIGVCRDCLLLINKQFECVYERTFEDQIISALLNPWSGELVTSGNGNITTLMFRQSGKVLSTSLVITDGLSSDMDISYLHLEDVPGKAQRCFAAIDCGVKVFLMNSGKLLSSLENLHPRPISALLFFRPLRLLITAAKDGAIKVWDSAWRLVCTFVGHSGSVTSLVPNPYGPMVVSGSMDCTIRVWNLANQDQVEILPHTTPVEGLSCDPGVYHVLSYSSRQVKAWRVQRLYTQSALTGAEVISLTGTTHPLVPLRILTACTDSAVRVVSPVTGDLLTTALIPTEKNIVSLAYFSFNELLHVLDDCGAVYVFNTADNPSSLVSSWTSPQDISIGDYSCLCLYEATMDDDDIEELLSSDKWLEVTLKARQLSHVKLTEKNPLDLKREGKSMLLAGTDSGCLAIVNSNGDVIYSTNGPSTSPVALMASNSRRSQVITASQEGSLDVWRLYPHTVEPLSHLLTFSLPSACPPSAIVSTRDRLCVACNNIELASYSVDMFDINEKASYTSQSEHSHTDRITALDAAHKLRLFVSCSLDSTVRVWTDDNHPVRVLHLDNPPAGLAFCSLQADIMIALHSHVHIIANGTYFNESLSKQLVSIRFPEPVPETKREWSVSLQSLPQTDRERLELVDNTISQDDYRGALSPEEMAALEEAARERAFSLKLISAREKEIKDIRDGRITANRKPIHGPLKGREKDTFWRDLLAVLRPGEPRLNIKVSEVDDFDPDTFGKPLQQSTTESQFEVGARYKFFPPLATFDPPYPLAPDGFLPNSVVLRGLRKSKADQDMAKGWKPPAISDKQRRLLEEMEELEVGDEEEVESNHDNDLMSRLQAAMSAAPLSPIPSPSPPPTPTPPTPPPKKVMAPRKPIQKFVAPKAPPPKSPTPPRTPTPPPPKSPTPPPTPPPPPTPLPEFIAQFIGQGWFDKLFPNANSSTFPRPWTVTKFIYSLLGCLTGSVDSITKADICAALLKLVLSHSPGNRADISSTVLSLLTTPPVPSTKNMAERYLIVHALKLLFQIADFDSKLAALMMAHYSEGDSELRKLIMNNLDSKGLIDPEAYFERLLVRNGNEEGDMFERSRSWLEDWAEQLAVSKGPKLSKPAKRSLKTNKKGAPKKSKVSFARGGSSPGLPTYDPMTVINYYVTIEHENELARRRVVTPPPPPPPEPEDQLPHNTVIALPKINRHGGLIRLGETHCSCCHADRETSLALLNRLPPHYNTPHPSDPTKLWRHFTHCLTLALKPQNINPFLSEEEKEAERELEELVRAQRVSVASMMKYFVPERSYVNSDT